MASSPSPMMLSRMQKELESIEKDPPNGISAWSKEGAVNTLEASIMGVSGTPYEGGVFRLELSIPNRYPFEPPKVRFSTPIYHPNIDSGGRICLDILNMPPKGAWAPSISISSLLQSVQVLMGNPNPDDPLMIEITKEYQSNHKLFEQKARDWTRRHAKSDSVSAGDADQDEGEESISQKPSSPDVSPSSETKRSDPSDDE